MGANSMANLCRARATLLLSNVEDGEALGRQQT
jgi:hypothetical protein